MPNIIRQIRAHHILFTIAIIGVVFYALSPLLFPDNHGLRQPELLPLYTAMLGLGQIVKGNSILGGGKDTQTKPEDNNDQKII